MPVQSRMVLAFATVLLAVVPVRADASEPSRSWRVPASLELEEEVPDEPPALTNASDDILARSPGFRVGFGSYESIQVNVDSHGQNIVGDAANEPSIAVNPLNRANKVIGWRQFNSISSNFRQAGWGYTFDAGLTWTFPGVLTPGVFRSDPVLDTDSNGTFYYQGINGNSFNLDVHRSTNGGVSWLPPVAEFAGDKNWMAVDRSGGIGNGNVYGAWQPAGSCCGENRFTRSTNGGASFQVPVSMDLGPYFGTISVGPGGEVYVSGADGSLDGDGTKLVVSRSTTAQNPAATPTFTGTRVDMGGYLGFGGPNPGGLAGQANVATDHSFGPTRGNVYLLSSIELLSGSDPLDVFLSRSTDGGATWSAPIRVNDDPSNANWQWFGAHAVAPDGRIDAIWNDSRNTGQVNRAQLYYAYSYDAGTTWSPNVAVSPPFDSYVGWPQQNKIGDYSTIVSDATGGDVAYAATFNGEQDVYYVRVFPDCNGNGVSDPVDITGGGSSDCDANRVPDECQAPALVPGCQAPGVVPDGSAVTGTPLVLAKQGAGDLLLTWGASCASGDDDYEVYEGVLGDFTSHASRLCTTLGATDVSLAPAAGSRYYLVVPTRGVLEGSYGKDSSGSERAQGHSACHPRAIGPCAR